MILEIKNPIPVLTPKGKGFAYFLIDYGMDHHLMWVCFMDDTGECWTFSNPEIRIQNNPTVGRVVSNAEPLVKNFQEQSQLPRSWPLQRPLPSGEVTTHNHLDTDPLRLRS